MEIKNIYWVFLPFLLVGCFVRCGKNDTPAENPHTHEIYTRPLSQIKVEIAGMWHIQQECTATIAGTSCDAPLNSSIDFLPDDSIRWVNNGAQVSYEKMEFYRAPALAYGNYSIDSLYLFKLPSNGQSFLVYSISNDTLEIRSPAVGPDYGFAIYLTR